MKIIAGLLLLLCNLFFIQVRGDATAKCDLRPNPSLPESKVSGLIKFTQIGDVLNITITVENLSPKSVHGFHIHAVGNITNCEASNTHYNPKNYDHGAPEDEIRHVGDLGNIIADDDGKVNEFKTDKIASLDKENVILDRTLVIHEKEDDFGKGGAEDSKKTGNAGKRLACCIIVKDN